MRWMLLIAFAVTIPAFVWLVARWPTRTDAPPRDPRERATPPRTRPVPPRQTRSASRRRSRRLRTASAGDL